MGVWVHGGKSTRVWLLLSFLLFRTRYVRCFMTIRCMCLMDVLTSRGSTLSFYGGFK